MPNDRATATRWISTTIPGVGSFVQDVRKDGSKRNICTIKTYPEDADRAEKMAEAVASLPELLREIELLADNYAKLLQEHGKPFGWGKITTESALRLVIETREKMGLPADAALQDKLDATLQTADEENSGHAPGM